MAILQVALDLTDLFKALKLAVEIANATKCINTWIEAGTPLIKKWGTLSVEALKHVTNCFIVADTKTMDTGALEAEIMFKAGADAVTVLGLADDSTIKEMVETSRRYNGVVIADLINHPDPFHRALELDEIGVDIILYHVGIDVQKKRGITAIKLLDEISRLAGKLRKARIAVAGGIKPGEAGKLVDAGAEIVIVGGAITRSSKPVEETLKLLHEIQRNQADQYSLG